MEIFKRRPLALACFAFLCTLVLSFFIDLTFKTILFVFAALAFILVLVLFIMFKRERNRRLSLMLSLLFVCISLVCSYFGFDRGYRDFLKYVGTIGEIEATVTNITYNENFASYLEIDVSRINDEKFDTKMKLECSYAFPFEEGETFCAKVKFAALEENINGYPEKMVGISKGQSLVALSDSPDDLCFVEAAKFNIFQYAKKLNLKLDNILDIAIGKESSGLARAILLGNKNALDSAESRDIKYVGVSHLLALSGMHLTILIGNVGILLSYVGLPKKPRLLILALLTAAYVVLTGMQMSMIRSAIMLFMTYVGFFVGRSRDMLTSLFFSVTLICTVSPGAFFDVGLELSFLSMVGMVTFEETLEEFFEEKLGRIKSDALYLCLYYLLMSVSITFIATLATLPIIWFYFGETSVIAIVGNFLLAPFADLILMLAPFVIILCKIPVLSECAAWCVGRLSDIMLDICAFFAKGRGVMVSLRYPFAKWIIIGFTLVIFVMLVIYVERKRAFLIPVAAAVCSFLICFAIYANIHKGELNLTHVTDSANDGFTVVCEGRTLICDVSSGSYNFILSLVLAGKELAVCDVDTYMLTHYHERHVHTLDRLSDEIYVRNVLLPTPTSEEEKEISSDIEEIAAEKGINVVFYDSGKDEKIIFKGVEIDVGRRTFIKRSTQPITALSFSNGNARVTYIGASVHESSLYEIFLPAVKESDAIIFGVHGPKVKRAFSYGALSPALKTVRFSSGDILGAVDDSDLDFAASLMGSELDVGTSSYHFVFD